MLEMYQHYKQLLTSSKYDLTLKKLLYNEALLFSIVRYRMFIDPIGFFYEIPLDEPLFKPVFKYTIKGFEDGQKVQSFSFSTLKKFALTLFFSGMVTDDFDYAKVARYIFYEKPEQNSKKQVVNSTSSVLDDITTNSLVPQKIIWQPPSFTDSSSASHLIKGLPHFGSNEALLMDKMVANPLIQWNFSRWATKFFTRLVSHKIKRTPSDLMRAKMESLKALLPKYLDTSSLISNSEISPLSLFISCEIDDLNSSIMKVRTEIHKAINGQLRDVVDSMEVNKSLVFSLSLETKLTFCLVG